MVYKTSLTVRVYFYRTLCEKQYCTIYIMVKTEEGNTPFVSKNGIEFPHENISSATPGLICSMNQDGAPITEVCVGGTGTAGCPSIPTASGKRSACTTVPFGTEDECTSSRKRVRFQEKAPSVKSTDEPETASCRASTGDSSPEPSRAPASSSASLFSTIAIQVLEQTNSSSNQGHMDTFRRLYYDALEENNQQQPLGTESDSTASTVPETSSPSSSPSEGDNTTTGNTSNSASSTSRGLEDYCMPDLAVERRKQRQQTIRAILAIPPPYQAQVALELSRSSQRFARALGKWDEESLNQSLGEEEEVSDH